jgi:hypothetical protein
MEQLGVLERVLASVDEMPVVLLYRALVGYALGPLYLAVAEEPARPWLFLPLSLAVLLALLLTPAVTRRLLPFSQPLREVWAERRMLARRYDSYQWRKLLGFGCGLGVWLLIRGFSSPVPLALAIGCAVGGLAGLWRWRQHASILRKTAAP